MNDGERHAHDNVVDALVDVFDNNLFLRCQVQIILLLWSLQLRGLRGNFLGRLSAALTLC